jgi:hypothetical protein
MARESAFVSLVFGTAEKMKTGLGGSALFANEFKI